MRKKNGYFLDVSNVVWRPTDRKSTRLNSSHANISYAVFCLKKKKKLSHISIHSSSVLLSFFFFNDTATTEIYTLSLHDALPISCIHAHIVHIHIGATIVAGQVHWPAAPGG